MRISVFHKLWLILRILLITALLFLNTSPLQALESPTASETGSFVVSTPIFNNFGEKLVFYSNKYGLGYQGIETAISIMRCESGIRPDAIGTNYRKGKLHSKDWSYWQINDKYWLDYYAKLGFNIKNPEHNLEVGFLLLSTDGVGPWSASSKCHGFKRQLAVK